MVLSTAKERKSLGFYLIRLIWLVVALAVMTLSIFGAYLNYQLLAAQGSEMTLSRLGIPLTAAGVLSVLIDGIPALIFFGLSVILFNKVALPTRPYDRMAMFTSLMLLSFSMLINGNLDALPEDSLELQLVYLIIALIGLTLFLFFFLVFPDGIVRPRWSWIFPVGLLVWILSWLVVPSLNPQHWSDLTFSLLSALLLVLGVSFQIYRYIHYSSPLQRQQTKMVCFSLVFLLFFGFLEILIENQVLPALENSPNYHWFLFAAEIISILGVIAFPLVLAIAIMRYRLWEIDLIIRRTLIYGILTAMLAGIYFGAVLLLQTIFSGWFTRLPGYVLGLMTIAIALLIEPLRRAIQNIIDKRFFRSKYNTEKTLEEFNQTIIQLTDLDEMLNRLSKVVDETMQPERVGIWLMKRYRDS